MSNLKEYLETKNNVIRQLQDQIETVLCGVGEYLNRMYEDGGLKAFEDKNGKLMVDPNYCGVAAIDVGEETRFYIPDQMKEYEGDDYYRGSWISSSQTC